MFEFAADGGDAGSFGEAELDGCFEERLPGHGGAFAGGGQFLDVGTGAGEGLGNFANDAGTVEADEVEGGEAAGGWRLEAIGTTDDGEGLRGEAGKIADERRLGGGGDFDSDDAGELAAEAIHATLEPVAAAAGDDAGEEFNETGTVWADNCEDEHGGGREIDDC